MDEPEKTPKEIRTAAFQELAIRIGVPARSEEEIRVLAYHEAGHIAVGMSLGDSIEVATILPSKKLEYYFYLLPRLLYDEESAGVHIRVLIAGEISELIVGGVEGGEDYLSDFSPYDILVDEPTYDWKKAVGIAKEFLPEDEEDALAYRLKECYRETVGILKNNWQVVESIAKELLEKNTLVTEDLEKHRQRILQVINPLN